MLKSHEKFHSANGKRKILVADDEFINRELLGNILQEDYEVLYACDGRESLNLLQEYQGQLSLLLLDLLMPEMNGLELLKLMKKDTILQRIPVIVLTSAHSAEVECLELGASDFIPKPYPQPEVILARVFRTIELSEDRDIIQSTERDSLTGLYNKEYFYRYAEQFDLHHKGLAMDAIVIDVNHFHMINERYGKTYGNEVLRRIGEKLQDMVQESDGIVCRREADTFLVYCPHREDYKTIIENASIGLSGEENAVNRIRLRMGVYSNTDKSIDIEGRFDRAKLAADTVRNSYAKAIAEYDSTLHESELYAEQLLEDFQEAVEQKQFKVYYQPKFNIRPEIPVLSSAEALVRWEHPRLGMISPGVFIPLFEDNGLIEQLDHYVWREAAAQIRDWKDRFGIPVPVSVNVSRIDMYNPELIQTLQQILEDYGLTTREFLLEITESAYTKNSSQIIDIVNQLRELGFRIEMDDFGTGYSSLNMFSTLPIDALKLDMQFIRNAFGERNDTRLLEAIIDIAGYFSVPVIAEGVETENQLLSLKAMGCDIVQGYYFSRPIPSEAYEQFIIEKQNAPQPQEDYLIKKPHTRTASQGHGREFSYGKIAHALSSGFESIYYVDIENGHYAEFSSQGRYEDLQIQRSGSDFFGDTQKNLRRVVYQEDQERVSLSMQKDALLPQLMSGHHFSMTYRLVIDGTPAYYNLKVVKANTHDNHHIVIGVSNVDEQIRNSENSEDIHGNHNFTYEEDQNLTLEFFSIAQALSSNFESIYYVDLDTDTYTEFTAQGAYENLQIELTGSDFFTECQRNILKVIYPEDQARLFSALQKDTLLKAVDSGKTFTLAYRLMISGQPSYYQLKAVKAKEKHGHHLVIGISNISAQIEQERKFEPVQTNSVTYSRIAQALARDYFTIYYVNTETDQYSEYSSQGPNHALTLIRSGEEFFEDCKRNIPEVVLPEYRERMMAAFDKNSLLTELENGKIFSIDYRLLINGSPIYASLKALRLADDRSHIIIGIRNIDAQMRREQEYESAKKQNVTYSSIAQALAADYFSIYYVDIETDHFIEYSSHDDYQDLNIEKDGDDFFNLSQKNILRVVYPEDQLKVSQAMIKENLLREMRKNSTFTLEYRLMFDDKPTYVSMKASHMQDNNDKHIVIGVSNVDKQMKREAELSEAKTKANRDALTGVKSKHAYVEMEAELNRLILQEKDLQFAVAVCDVNGLKAINDTLGHKAGDKHIKDASAIICNIFKHSPVFRIGGDEFVVILQGQDYENRSLLMTELAEKNQKGKQDGDVIIASGLSIYVTGKDTAVLSVFERADAAMYVNKKELKGIR